MARAKKRTKAEKEERAKLYNQITSGDMMSSSRVNGNIIKSLHQKTDFGENDLGEDIEMDLKTLTEVMQTVSDKVKDGDLSNLEGMLVSQTYSLQHMFMTMASKVSSTTNPDYIDLFARFALKAQNQCRTTIATLSEMKNPKRATFIKQLNQANQMQVNNDDSDSEILKKIPTLQTNYWSKQMANGWTPERRAKQSAMMKHLQPWKKSTGPKTEAGKQQSSKNSYKHGMRSAGVRELHKLMTEYSRMEREARMMVQ